ncbi:hypothetical protein ACFL1H_02995 [Nanoarchaeota archaeon]
MELPENWQSLINPDGEDFLKNSMSEDKNIKNSIESIFDNTKELLLEMGYNGVEIKTYEYSPVMSRKHPEIISTTFDSDELQKGRITFDSRFLIEYAQEFLAVQDTHDIKRMAKSYSKLANFYNNSLFRTTVEEDVRKKYFNEIIKKKIETANHYNIRSHLTVAMRTGNNIEGPIDLSTNSNFVSPVFGSVHVGHKESNFFDKKLKNQIDQISSYLSTLLTPFLRIGGHGFTNKNLIQQWREEISPKEDKQLGLNVAILGDEIWDQDPPYAIQFLFEDVCNYFTKNGFKNVELKLFRYSSKQIKTNRGSFRNFEIPGLIVTNFTEDETVQVHVDDLFKDGEFFKSLEDTGVLLDSRLMTSMLNEKFSVTDTKKLDIMKGVYSRLITDVYYNPIFKEALPREFQGKYISEILKTKMKKCSESNTGSHITGPIRTLDGYLSPVIGSLHCTMGEPDSIDGTKKAIFDGMCTYLSYEIQNFLADKPEY